MNRPLPFSARGLEIYYGLDRLCQCLYQHTPQHIRLYGTNTDIVMMAARRLYWVETLIVDTVPIAEVVSQLPYPTVKVATASDNADAGLILFNRFDFDTPPRHTFLAVFADNRLSYKVLMYPKNVYDTSFGVRRWLSQAYTIDEHIGLFGGRFLSHWTRSTLFANHNSVRHFREQQRALDTIYDTSPLAYFAYLQLFVGVSSG